MNNENIINNTVDSNNENIINSIVDLNDENIINNQEDLSNQHIEQFNETQNNEFKVFGNNDLFFDKSFFDINDEILNNKETQNNIWSNKVEMKEEEQNVFQIDESNVKQSLENNSENIVQMDLNNNNLDIENKLENTIIENVVQEKTIAPIVENKDDLGAVHIVESNVNLVPPNGNIKLNSVKNEETNITKPIKENINLLDNKSLIFVFVLGVILGAFIFALPYIFAL